MPRTAHGVKRIDYLPYGEFYLGGCEFATDRLFNGQRRDVTGLYHYDTREYCPVTRRFIQPSHSIVCVWTNPMAAERPQRITDGTLAPVDSLRPSRRPFHKWRRGRRVEAGRYAKPPRFTKSGQIGVVSTDLPRALPTASLRENSKLWVMARCRYRREDGAPGMYHRGFAGRAGDSGGLNRFLNVLDEPEPRAAGASFCEQYRFRRGDICLNNQFCRNREPRKTRTASG